MKIRFWGVRGSTPSCTHDTQCFGGNTPCVELRARKQLIVVDAGTGIQRLGQNLSRSDRLAVTLLLSHYHWDHIQGLPFFIPLYQEASRLRLLGPHLPCELSPHGMLEGLFRRPFFPVSPEQLRSNLELKALNGGSDILLGDVRVKTCWLNHPQGALAYRFEHDGASLVYATDHEPGNMAIDGALQKFAHGADLLISDAQYLPGELARKAGWGHGSWETSVALARGAGVRNLLLFHLDPARTDREMEAMLAQARRLFANTWAAREGMVVELTGKEVHIVEGAETELSFAGTSPVRGSEEAGADNQPGSAEDAREGAVASGVAPELGRTRATRRNGSAQATSPSGSQQGAEHRRYSRLPLDGSGVHGFIRYGDGRKAVRVVDLSFGGISFLVYEKPSLPDVVHARFQVPLLPPAEFRIKPVYARAVADGVWRVGCRFFG